MTMTERPWLDASLAQDERVRLLMAAMTTEEKVAQMIQISYSIVTPEEADAWARRGAGSFLHILGNNARRIQRLATETRLGIPVIFGIDAIHGHAIHNGATVFPSQLALAASWDPDAAEKVGEVTAKEVTAEGLHWTFSPVLCLGRDLRWGRINETFGEDPFLAGKMGAGIIRGYQGRDTRSADRIIACAKHYIAYGESTGGRDSYDAPVSMRKIRETFLPPFAEAVKAGCLTFMAGYEPVDGVPVSANRKLLRDILKDELGFDGFVVTDWSNVTNLLTRQRMGANAEEVSTIALEAGNDLIMTSPEFYESILSVLEKKRAGASVGGGVSDGGTSGAIAVGGTSTSGAIAGGGTSTSGGGAIAGGGSAATHEELLSLIDDAVSRIISVKIRAGLFDVKEKVKTLPLESDPEAGACERIFNCDAHQRVNLDVARKSIVLLKNEKVGDRNALPVHGPARAASTAAKVGESRRVKTVAVIGPNADSVRAQFGDWTFFTHPTPKLDAMPTFRVTTMLDGIRRIAESEGASVLFDKGCDLFDPELESIKKARGIAKKADIVFLAVGDTLQQTGEHQDRANLALSGAQNELTLALREVCSKKKIPLVAILVNGKPLEFETVARACDAVIETFNSGTLGGKAAAEIIFGLVQPEGRLPISFPRTTGQLPVYYNQLPGWHEGRYFDCEATSLFAFGEGLSYTTFRYDAVSLSREKARAGDIVEASVTVTNTGLCDGTETVQVYAADRIASIVRPVRELKGFAKVHIEAGKTVTVAVPIPVDSLALVNSAEITVLEPGEFEIQAGHDSRPENLLTAVLTVE